MQLTVATLALTAGLLAAAILKTAWRGASEAPRGRVVAAWALVAAALAGSQLALGPALGPFAVASFLSLGALVWIAAGVSVRRPRSRAGRDVALEPSERPSIVWRGWLRALLAGPVGGLAALGVGLAWAVWIPGAPQTRMVVGGILVALLWAGAMAWTLADDRILRAAGVLFGVALVTFTASALRGFA